MPDTVDDFWKLLAQSRLFGPEECRKLAAAFAKGHPTDASPTAVAEWLVSKRYVTPYQAKVLLSGRPGPFVYGQYVVYDRIKAGPLTGKFRARNLASKQKVCLRFVTGPLPDDPQTLVDSQVARYIESVELGNYRFLVLEELPSNVGEELPGHVAEAGPVQDRVEAATVIADAVPVIVASSRSVTGTRARLSAKRTSRNRAPLIISGLALVAAGAVALLMLGEESPSPIADVSKAVSDPAAAQFQQAADVGTGATPVAERTLSPEPSRTLATDLWASPTSGAALDLRYLPSEARVYVALRPAAILAHPEGEKTLAALGPLGKMARDQLPESTGVPFDAMDQAVVAFIDRAPDPPAVAIMVRVSEALSESTLLAHWGDPKLDGSSPGKLFRGAERTYYLPANGNQRLLAVMPDKNVQDVLELGDQPPLLRPEVERLVQASDSDRLVNVLFTPDFLLMPGNSFLSGSAQHLKIPLEELFGTDVKAGLLSCHLDGPNLFTELLVSGTVDRTPTAVAKTLQDRLHTARLRIEDYVRPMSADPYGGKLLFRFPQMLAELEQHTRAASLDRQVVLRCYLPDRAAHNLALAAQLALDASGGAGTPQTAVAAAAPQSAPKSIEQRLKQVTSLSFPLENLENAVATLAAEIGVEIKILGSDLQLEGITRNQQFKDLNEVDKPADEILRQILIKARPDGKLVYVIGKDGAEDVVYITIRSKAKERGQLPPELAP